MDEPTAQRPDDQARVVSHGCPAGTDHDREVPEIDLLSPLTIREVTLRNAAELAMVLKKWDTAIGYWDRALQVNPWRWEYHYGLASAHAQKGAWGHAVMAANKALQFNPARLEIRDLLMVGYVQLGDKAKARAEVDRILGFNPPDAEQLRRWAAENLR